VDEESQPGLPGEDFGSVADGPASFGRRSPVPCDEEHATGLLAARSDSAGEFFDSTDSGLLLFRESMSEARGQRA
jgi:hypothetical protein